MPEVVAVVVNDQLNYEGFFNMYEVIRVMEKFFRTKGFDKKIIFDEEFHTAAGIYVHMKLDNYKKVDNYIRQVVRLWIYANDLTDVEKEVEGEKVKMHKGKLSITFDGYLVTDYDGRWETTPFYFIFRTMSEKYFLRARFKFYEDLNRRYINECRAELSTYLNMNKYLY
jgi:hypothetical protein